MKKSTFESPFVLTIFGASGDLAKLKLFPALYELMYQKRLNGKFHIVGFARSERTQKQFQDEFIESIRAKIPKEELDEKILSKLTQNISYFQGNYSDQESYIHYRKYLLELIGQKNFIHIAYFSVPPQVFQPIIQNLGETKVNPQEDLRLVIEKPFGQDYKSATELFHFIAQYFSEEKVYLLDHYLGKPSVKSILNLRHNNRILNLMLKGSEIANIQITAFEQVGVENRIGYFDQVGTIKDMFQSHLVQILGLITMSIPITSSAESIQREKTNVISALKFHQATKNIVTGQYQSYPSEDPQVKNSQTETFMATRLFLDHESWFNVPIYIRTGKKLKKKHTSIVIEFKKFEFQDHTDEPNLLIIELYPEEKFSIKLVNKNLVGESFYRGITTSDYIGCEGDDCLPEHSVLLMEVLHENKIDFLCFPEILAAWKFTEEIVDFLKSEEIIPHSYQDLSAGPPEHLKIPENDGFKWHEL